jgi:hypothetical protein
MPEILNYTDSHGYYYTSSTRKNPNGLKIKRRIVSIRLLMTITEPFVLARAFSAASVALAERIAGVKP